MRIYQIIIAVFFLFALPQAASAQTPGEKAYKQKSYDIAEKLLTQECNSNKFLSCIALAELYNEDKFARKDPNKAAAMDRKILRCKILSWVFCVSQ